MKPMFNRSASHPIVAVLLAVAVFAVPALAAHKADADRASTVPLSDSQATVLDGISARSTNPGRLAQPATQSVPATANQIDVLVQDGENTKAGADIQQ